MNDSELLQLAKGWGVFSFYRVIIGAYLVAVFILKQLVTIQNSLKHRMAVVLIMTGLNSFDQISPDMGITTASSDVFRLVITTVNIEQPVQLALGDLLSFCTFSVSR